MNAEKLPPPSQFEQTYSFLNNPKVILVDPFIHSSIIRSYECLPQNTKALDFFDLSESEQLSLLQKVRSTYLEIENSHPAAGYKIRIVGSNGGKNPLELHLQAINEREIYTPMQMPVAKESCPFCKKIENDDQIDALKEPKSSAARVIKTLQGNALVISSDHSEHWFKNSASAQLKMLQTCKKVIDELRQSGPYNYELHIHMGSEGHQKIPHTHIHILSGTNLLLE